MSVCVYCEMGADELCRCLKSDLPQAAIGEAGGSGGVVNYVLQYGGRCRDCADECGICPGSGLPCESDAARKAIRWVIDALTYGTLNGYCANPLSVALAEGEAPRQVAGESSRADLPQPSKDSALVEALRPFVWSAHLKAPRTALSQATQSNRGEEGTSCTDSGGSPPQEAAKSDGPARAGLSTQYRCARPGCGRDENDCRANGCPRGPCPMEFIG